MLCICRKDVLCGIDSGGYQRRRRSWTAGKDRTAPRNICIDESARRVALRQSDKKEKKKKNVAAKAQCDRRRRGPILQRSSKENIH